MITLSANGMVWLFQLHLLFSSEHDVYMLLYMIYIKGIVSDSNNIFLWH